MFIAVDTNIAVTVELTHRQDEYSLIRAQSADNSEDGIVGQVEADRRL